MEFLNSNLGLMLIVLLGLAFVALIVKWKPKLAKYKGRCVAAIKWAENIIPDGTPNKSLRRLDAALDFMIKVIESREGRKPNAKIIDDIKDTLCLVHNQLEADGVLAKKKTKPATDVVAVENGGHAVTADDDGGAE